MLPDGFHWAPRAQQQTDSEAVICLGYPVAYLDQTVSGDWIARLDAHKGMEFPLQLRRCRNLAAGRAGVERWVARHEGRLRAEVEARDAGSHFRRWLPADG